MCIRDRLVDSTPLAEIAEKFGTPLYVYSGNGIRDAYTSFASAVAPVAGKVHFALKANSALGVIALLARHGAGADIVSGGELERALAAGIAPADIVFSGVGKSRAEITQALTAGVISARLLPTPEKTISCLLYTSPSPRDATLSRMPSSA